MKAEELFNEIHDFCEENADEQIVKKYSRFFREGYDAYGLTHAHIEEIVRKVLNIPTSYPNLIFETSELLVKTGKYEETNIAILLVTSFTNQFPSRVFTEISKWFDFGIRNWAHCDILCTEVLSPLLVNSYISLRDLESWKTSKNKYQKRAVPVSLIKLLSTKYDIAKLLAFIESMMMVKEREVHQGLGWFIKEAWRKDKSRVEDFLMKWKDTSPRLIINIGTERMTKSERARFKKEIIKKEDSVNEVIENEVIENERIESDTIENDITENNTIENDTIENDIIEKDATESNIIEKDTIKKKKTETYIIENNIL